MPAPKTAVISASTDVQDEKRYWVFKDPFDFDNVGFSKALTSDIQAGREGMRYLCCADCDFAPIGLQDTLLDGVIVVPIDRLRYTSE